MTGCAECEELPKLGIQPDPANTVVGKCAGCGKALCLVHLHVYTTFTEATVTCCLECYDKRIAEER